MTQLRQRESEFADKHVQVYVVTFDDNFLARAYVEQTSLKWPLLIDRELKLYRAFSMDRGTWWAIINPISIWKYLLLMFRGRKLQKSGADYRQMGGNVLIDPTGKIRFHYVSTTPHDRPTVDEILEVVGSAEG